LSHQEALKLLARDYLDIAGMAFYLMTGDSDDVACEWQHNCEQVIRYYSIELRWIVQELRSWALNYARLPFEHDAPDADLQVKLSAKVDVNMTVDVPDPPSPQPSSLFPDWPSIPKSEKAAWSISNFAHPKASPPSPRGPRSKAAVEKQYALIKSYIDAESSRRSAALSWAHLHFGKPKVYRTTPEVYESRDELVYAASVPPGPWYAAEIDEHGMLVHVDDIPRCVGQTQFTDGLRRGKLAEFAYTAEKQRDDRGR
jgi:hypothetical protein